MLEMNSTLMGLQLHLPLTPMTALPQPQHPLPLLLPHLTLTPMVPQQHLWSQQKLLLTPMTLLQLLLCQTVMQPPQLHLQNMETQYLHPHLHLPAMDLLPQKQLLARLSHPMLPLLSQLHLTMAQLTPHPPQHLLHLLALLTVMELPMLFLL
jgi:hypothetical protein